MSERIYNFSAGPSMVPESVITRARDALWSLGDSGIGIMEHSHRGPEFTDILTGAEATCRDLAGVPDTHDVLFLQGGASSQFFMVPMNLLGPGDTADFIHTGTWSRKAMAEARRFGAVHVAATSEVENFTYIPSPEATRFSSAPRYVYFTSNNTMYGTQFATPPSAPEGVPLVCDACSDIFSRPLDIPRYGVLFAGAQKNLGPSGVTLVIIRKDLVEGASRDVPTMLSYRTHAAGQSRFNTPPTFAIYVVGLVLEWLREFGGLDAIAEYNRAKAALLYDFIDSSEFYRGVARPESRSLMNVVFHLARPELEAEFIGQARAAGLAGLEGHKDVGGLRASIYNAFPIEGCHALVEFMKQFERANR